MVQTKRKAASVSSAASADDHEKNGTTRSKRQKASTWVKSDDDNDNDNDDDKDNDEHAEADGIAAGMSVPYGNTTDQKFDTAIDPANTKDNAQSTNGEAISGADDLNGEDNKISPGSEEENSQDAVKPSEKASFETQVKSEIVDEPKAENSSKSQPDSVPSIAPINEEEEEEIETLDEEEKKRIHTYNFDGYMYTYKDRPSVIEEQEGKIEFRVVNNDNSRDNMIVLTGLKNIFQKQLPEMPKAYIARLVYDRSHVSIAVVREPLTVVGGITIRPFETHEFAEIVFCAISSTEQVRGYGAHLMNHLKDYVLNTTKIKYFLTYADNYAIGYFKKQGFTKEITLPKKVWMGYIKDYEGGTLMQCTMLSGIRYLDSPKILSIQKAAILRKIRSIGKSHIVRKGLDHFKKEGFTPLNPFDIPGVKEAGWTREMDDLAQKPKRGPHYIAMLTIFTEMQNHPSNWPFMQPVSKTEVPDYYEVIKEPMDLSTMEVKLENDAYETMDDFIYDCKLIFNNCRQYNGENTTFYKNANKLEKSVVAKLKDFPEYSACLDILTKR